MTPSSAAVAFLERFVLSCRTRTVGSLVRERMVPHPGDAARVFRPEVAPAVEQAASELFAAFRPEVELHFPTAAQTELTVWAAWIDELADHPEFPGGYATVVPFLREGPVWYRWRIAEPGADAGIAYDGLVDLGDRFAWFPKPWRMLPTH
ncbi:MAG: hypothetical protein H6738_09935 [Alphaproteobacteria bacterium]|nr:hypothetical protein [Alphaproteobacteria bacterium]MCB9697086.1 hypothetical protein [Alphaproteobacteria bacterium]